MPSQLYNALEEVLKRYHCDIGAAECHGMLCGIICGQQHHDMSTWLAHSFGYQEDLELGKLTSDEVLAQLFRETRQALDADDFSFEILIPDDDQGLADRAEALGDWCRGFLSGFGLSELTDLKQLSDDSQEYLNDLKELSRVEANDEDSDSEEFAFIEVQEYARMGAMLVRDEVRALQSAAQGSKAIH